GQSPPWPDTSFAEFACVRSALEQEQHRRSRSRGLWSPPAGRPDHRSERAAAERDHGDDAERADAAHRVVGERATALALRERARLPGPPGPWVHHGCPHPLADRRRAPGGGVAEPFPPR